MTDTNWQAHVAVGDTVEHPKHGRGVVKEIRDAGVVVRFPGTVRVIANGAVVRDLRKVGHR